MKPETQHLETAFLILLKLIILSLLFALPGCTLLDNYERSYSLEYEGAKVGVTLRPRGYSK